MPDQPETEDRSTEVDFSGASAPEGEVGLLDTSVVVDLEIIPAGNLPTRVAICAITLAELSAGPVATSDLEECARRQGRLQRVEATFEPIPFEVEAARAYARISAAIVARGRKPRRRMADLLIASVALAEGIPLVTRNPDDFAGLEGLLEIRAV